MVQRCQPDSIRYTSYVANVAMNVAYRIFEAVIGFFAVQIHEVYSSFVL